MALVTLNNLGYSGRGRFHPLQRKFSRIINCPVGRWPVKVMRNMPCRVIFIVTSIIRMGALAINM